MLAAIGTTFLSGARDGVGTGANVGSGSRPVHTVAGNG